VKPLCKFALVAQFTYKGEKALEPQSTLTPLFQALA